MTKSTDIHHRPNSVYASTGSDEFPSVEVRTRAGDLIEIMVRYAKTPGPTLVVSRDEALDLVNTLLRCLLDTQRCNVGKRSGKKSLP
jgi:hypothetical protein